MLRASDIFGRNPGAISRRPTVPAQASPGNGQKRALGTSVVGPTSKVWDSATGTYIEEALPAEVQELMGMRPKKVKAEAFVKEEQWGQTRKPPAKALGPAAVGLAPVKANQRGPLAKEIDTSAPSVEYKGFSKVDLNDRFYENTSLNLNGRPTFWSSDASFFVYWQGEVGRWAICDAPNLFAVKQGQFPGWAYKEDHKHLCQASGWMEAWNGDWHEPSLEVTYRSFSTNPPQWEDPVLQKAISVIEYHGFAMKELNTRYYVRMNEYIQGKPSYWDDSGVYFIYWQKAMRRWAICDLKCMEAVQAGQCPGWAYRVDAGHFANACGWMERRAEEWTNAIIESAVVGVCTKGLKVEFSGFGQQELNTTYVEKPEEEVQGRSTFWDPSDNYFIYWQSSMQRWAICDRVSLAQAKSGLAPGWAYRTDAAHFTRSRGWMEVWGREWKQARITCVVLEGNVKDDYHALVKAELQEENGDNGNEAPAVSPEQYQSLIRLVYEEKNPGKLGDLNKIFEKYKDRELELYTNVCRKYEVDAEALVAQEAAAAKQPATPATKEEEGGDFAELENSEAPELTAKEYATHVQNIYLQYNPKKLKDLGALLQKFRHKERDLYLEVCRKYGVHPAKFHAKHAASLKEQLHAAAKVET